MKRTLNKAQRRLEAGLNHAVKQHLITHFHQWETSENETALHHYPCGIHVFNQLVTDLPGHLDAVWLLIRQMSNSLRLAHGTPSLPNNTHVPTRATTLQYLSTKTPCNGLVCDRQTAQLRFTEHTVLPLLQCLALTINNCTGNVSRLQVITCLSSITATSKCSPLSLFGTS